MNATRLIFAWLLAFAAVATAQESARKAPERKTGGVLLSTSFQIESSLMAYQLSADRRTKLEYTEKHLLSIDPVADQFELTLGGEVAEGLHRIEFENPILSPAGKYVVAETAAGLAVFESGSGKKVTLHTFRSPHACQTVLCTGEHLLLGTVDGEVRVRSLCADQILFVFPAHEKPIRWIASTRLGGKKPQDLILTGSEDRTIRVWKVSVVDIRVEPGITLKLDHTPRLVALDDACERLITASTKEVQLWDLERGRLLKTVEAPDEVSCVTLSSDGKSFAFGTVTGEVVFGESKRGKVLAAWEAHADHYVLAVHVVEQEGRPVLITAGLDHDVCYWDAGKLAKEFGKGKKRR